MNSPVFLDAGIFSWSSSAIFVSLNLFLQVNVICISWFSFLTFNSPFFDCECIFYIPEYIFTVLILDFLLCKSSFSSLNLPFSAGISSYFSSQNTSSSVWIRNLFISMFISFISGFIFSFRMQRFHLWTNVFHF